MCFFIIPGSIKAEISRVIKEPKWKTDVSIIKDRWLNLAVKI
jgi:hypothetical protein